MAPVIYERCFWEQQHLVAGIDEAGRGCLAGPVVVAAVVLSPNDIELATSVNDSKILRPSVREELFAAITQSAIEWNVTLADVALIEERNILRATLEAMRGAVEALRTPIAHVFVDGPVAPQLSIPATAIVSGDRCCASVAAASIVAKVIRDRIMVELAQQYPEYGFDRHKGYATREHFHALEQWGPTREHRMAFLRKWRQRSAQQHLL
ncbi:MAG: ribonuclease HII [Candidatus Kapaibacterium sp.]|nr:MAG: ribonuclease HII [Candidatus Kapabacteria bacterium]